VSEKRACGLLAQLGHRLERAGRQGHHGSRYRYARRLSTGHGGEIGQILTPGDTVAVHCVVDATGSTGMRRSEPENVYHIVHVGENCVTTTAGNKRQLPLLEVVDDRANPRGDTGTIDVARPNNRDVYATAPVHLEGERFRLDLRSAVGTDTRAGFDILVADLGA